MSDVPPNRVGVWIARGCVVYVVVAVVLGAAAVFLPGSSWDPFRPRPQLRLTCTSNLSQLAGLHAQDAESGIAAERSGQALLLAWRKSGRIRRGQELVLVCPGDPGVVVPDTPEAMDRYDAIDLDAPPDDICSYAVRDFGRFPPDPERLSDEPFAACVGRFHDGRWSAFHKGGMVVAFCDGGTRFVPWEEAGLDPDAHPPDVAPVVGPESPSPLLRVLCFRLGETSRAVR